MIREIHPWGKNGYEITFPANDNIGRKQGQGIGKNTGIARKLKRIALKCDPLFICFRRPGVCMPATLVACLQGELKT
jgi:hypothetical protein